jgi:hypothetical protein
MANCVKTLGAYYGRPTWFEKVFPSSRPWSDERLNDPGHSILVRKSYNFARYLNLTFTDLENNANLLFKN